MLTQKYFDGNVPPINELNGLDKETLKSLETFPKSIEKSIELYRFREGLAEMMNLARLGNKYLTENEPWKIFKTNPKRVETIMNISLQIAANLCVLSEPFLPFTAENLYNMLQMNKLAWDNAGNSALLKPGHVLGKPAFLFERIEDADVEKQVEKLMKTKEENQTNTAVNPQKEEITYDDFVKTDLRVGTILEAVKVPKTKKLIQLKIDTGIDVRTVVSGIAEYYQPEEIIGKQVAVLVNLSPRKLRGITSQGMILMAEDKNGKLHFVAPESVVNNGSEIK